MRVFIHYSPKRHRDTFEGSRLRKTLKGACELLGIHWLDFPSSPADVAHFISPNDYSLLKQKKKQGIPTIVSCGYAENDPSAIFFNEDMLGNLFLTRAGKKMLLSADAVTVPSEPIKKILIRNGISTPIEVIEPAVNMERFAKTATERDIFLHYFRIHSGTKTVVATGSYNDRKSISLMKKVAEKTPDLEFYFFGSSSILDPLSLVKSAHSRRKANNLHFCSLVQDDIYRSALMSSIAYIANGSAKPEAIALLEAFASKTQVVGLSKVGKNPLMINKETCFLFPDADSMAAYLNSFYKGKAKDTIMAAYDIARSHSLLNLGKELQSLYTKLIENKKGSSL